MMERSRVPTGSAARIGDKYHGGNSGNRRPHRRTGQSEDRGGVRGAVGKTCEAMTHDLEQMLGGVVVERVYQDSYHRHDTEQSEHESQDDRA